MAKQIFAAGLGIKEGPSVRYGKVFIHTKKNDGPVQDFLRIVRDFSHYGDTNTVIKMNGVDLEGLYQAFTENNHSSSATFIKETMKLRKKQREKAFICIMTTNAPPTCFEESYLVMELFSVGFLNALNLEHRKPLIKVFAGLPTVWMSSGGIPGDYHEAHDKIPSWLMLRDPGTNRFAPTSFVRNSAYFGTNNTIMMGVTVDFGVCIGNDNLLGTHCSIASCVQMGNHNNVGAFVSMEGVSSVNENPVVVGNDNFFETRVRIGTGLVIGDKNFFGSGVDISMGTPLKDIRKGYPNYGKYVMAGSKEGIQRADMMMVTLNRSHRRIGNFSVYPGEYLLNNNNEENQIPIEDLIINNWQTQSIYKWKR